MTVEELFGTLQQSVVSAWRKHLKAYKYSDHMALDEFYDEMPEKVDDLIEAWMGVNGKKLKNYTNILNSSNMGTLKYLHELRRLVKQGYPLMNGESELEAKLDDILELIDSTLYKIKELGGENTNENKYKMKDLKDFINESLCVNESNEELELKKDYEWCYSEELEDLASEGIIDEDSVDELMKLKKNGSIVIPKGTELKYVDRDRFYNYYELSINNITIAVLKDELSDLMRHCK